LVFALTSFYFIEVTYALDPITCSADNVGFGTWFWRGRKFSPHSLSSRSRRVDRQSASRPQSRLTGKVVRLAVLCDVVRAPGRLTKSVLSTLN
jgi:hypothetical protein